MPYEVKPEFECSFAIGDTRCRQTASGYVQRDIPPVVYERCQTQPDLANDLGPHMERCVRVFPRTQRQSGPALRLIEDGMNHSELPRRIPSLRSRHSLRRAARDPLGRRGTIHRAFPAPTSSPPRALIRALISQRLRGLRYSMIEKP